jgi:hypothetical protein
MTKKKSLLPVESRPVLTKLTSRNRLTLPKAVMSAIDPPEYFEAEARDGRIILTPVRIQCADEVRAKLALLDLKEKDLSAAVTWARQKW